MKDRLRQSKITATVPRQRVWNYIKDNHTHPSADEVYYGLCEEHANIARSTVYNALTLFVEKNLINTIRGEDDVLRYDPNQRPHAHFQCQNCQRMWDVPYNTDALNVVLPRNFSLGKVELRYLGLCSACQQKHTGQSL